MHNPIRMALALLALLGAGIGSVAAAGPAGPHLGGAARALGDLVDLLAAGASGVLTVGGTAAARLDALVRAALAGDGTVAPTALVAFLAGLGAAALLAALLLVLAFSRQRPPSRFG